MLTKNDRTRIREAAEGIRREYKINKFPAKLSNILKSKDIKVYQADLDKYDISGYIEKSNDKKRIVINKNHSDTRNIFTLAHELGHDVLGHLENNDKIISFRGRIGLDDRINELEADLFAAELLMPKREMLKEITLNYDKPNLPSILSKKFGVSLQAVKYRMKELKEF